MLHTGQEDFIKGLIDILTRKVLAPDEASIMNESYISQKRLFCGTLAACDKYKSNDPTKYALCCMFLYIDKCRS